MGTPLADLDELLLRCRDSRARSLISEAVGCYKVGAFRSAVVATWIAICFDLIEKLRELTLAGDKAAEALTDKLDRLRRANDLTGTLAFERDLLKVAQDDFELISHLEYVDLERIQIDRNRCAHPSLVDDGNYYLPSAELVRAHIYAAVEHVLRHPPAQGKYALERLLVQVDSEYFPVKKEEALTVLSAGPLSRPRDSLVRNFTVVLLKKAFEDSTDRRRYSAALHAVRQMHRDAYEAALVEKLSHLLRPFNDGSLYGALVCVKAIPGGWDALDVDVKHRLKQYVRALPSDHITHLDWLLDYAPIAEDARSRTARATRKELKESFFFGLPSDLANRFVDLYIQSKSFDEANEWAKELVGYKDSFSPEHVTRILKEGAQNPEIAGSFRFPDLIVELRRENILEVEKFEELLDEAGLSHYMLVNMEDIPF